MGFVFKPNLETKDIFENGNELFFERLQWSFGFEFESNMYSNESGCFLLTLLTYSNTSVQK
jgi:hypothetical protein